MKQFRYKPVTVDVVDPDGENSVLWIGRSARYGPVVGAETPYVVEIAIRDDVKIIGLGDITRDTSDEVIATTASGYTAKIRETLPRDAERAISIDSSIPLPPVVAAMMVSRAANERDSSVQPTLSALVDDEGLVATLMLTSNAGLFARYDNVWVDIADIDSIEGLDAYDVEDSALELYDEHDQVGESVHIVSMPLTKEELATRPLDQLNPPPPPGERTEAAEPESPNTPEAPAVDTQTDDDTDATGVEAEAEVAAEDDVEDESEQARLVASGTSVIASLEDLEQAIPLGLRNPDARWFIERRATALGYEGELPWETGT